MIRGMILQVDPKNQFPSGVFPAKKTCMYSWFPSHVWCHWRVYCHICMKQLCPLLGMIPSQHRRAVSCAHCVNHPHFEDAARRKRSSFIHGFRPSWPKSSKSAQTRRCGTCFLFWGWKDAVSGWCMNIYDDLSGPRGKETSWEMADVWCLIALGS